MLVAPQGLLAMVPNSMGAAQSTPRQYSEPTSRCRVVRDEESTHFGDLMELKKKHTLQIGFQNIGGVSAKCNKIKDDILRIGLGKFDFDVFRIAEVNVNWAHVPEAERLVHRSKQWWECSHFTYANNRHSTNRLTHQYGGVAMWSIGKAAHRVIALRRDPTGLGRWVWTRYRGRNNITLRIFTAYRPNPPAEGPFTVHAQHRTYFNSLNVDKCPRQAFLDDLCIDIRLAQEEGDNTVVMLDGNEDMRSGKVYEAFHNCNLHEATIHRHGTTTPSTYIRNTNMVPIDGIWCNPSLSISAGGYCEFDQVFFNTDHRTVWIEISYVQAFGHRMPAIMRPQARRLKCKDPRCVDNFIRFMEQYISSHNLIDQALELESISEFPLSQHAQVLFE
jgi:hypothetical protein